jgi:aspartyl-tRNA(Asn)/glutamyl-tRNA(Gln) amidotransferase subunit A
MDEFGMGSHSTHSAFGAVKNGPGLAALSVGGSSGGSAYAVASEQCHIALGTDTGGSVRLPAAYLGLVGFKPSYGLLSRHGVVPYANSLDTVGIIAKTCLDVFLTFQALNSPDEKDPTCLSLSSRRRIQLAKQQRRPGVDQASPYRVVPITGHTNYRPKMDDFPSARRPVYASAVASNPRRRIGFPLEYNIVELHPLVRAAWTRTLSMLESSGHEIVPVSLPSTKAALSAYYVLAPAEASSNLAKYDGVRYGATSKDSYEDGKLYAAYRGAHFGEEVKRRILLGAFSLSADAIDNYFIQAQKVRRVVQEDFDMVFRMKNPLHDNVETSQKGVDFIVCPTAPTPPPRLSKVKEQTSLDAYINDVFTVPASLAGLPAISVPAPLFTGSDNDPARMVGMQIIGQYGDDFSVIQFAKNEFEANGNWSQLRRLREPPRLR